MSTFIKLYLENTEYLAIMLINLIFLLKELAKEKPFSIFIRFLSSVYFISCVYLIMKSKFEIMHFTCLIWLIYFLLNGYVKKK